MTTNKGMNWSFEEDENGKEYLKVTAPSEKDIRQALIKEIEEKVEELDCSMEQGFFKEDVLSILTNLREEEK